MATPAAPEAYDCRPTKSVSVTLPTTDADSKLQRSLEGVDECNQQTHDQHEAPPSFDDAVTWPINRCCYEELKPAELATVEQLFAARDDAPALMKWVVLHRGHRRFDKQLLVISAFRVWLLKHRKQPLFKSALTTAKEMQLLHLHKVQVLRTTTMNPSDPTALTTSITLHVRGHRTPDDEMEQVHFDPGVHAETIVRLLQRLLHSMRLAFPSQQLPTLCLPPQCHWQEFFASPASPRPQQQSHQSQSRSSNANDRGGCGSSKSKDLNEAITTAYRCFCDDLGVPHRASVTSRLQECVDALCVDFQYCLSASSSSSGSPVIGRDTSGVGGALMSLARVVGLHRLGVGGGASALQWKEVQALARTLEHCQCFDDIVVYDFRIGDVGLSALFQVLLSPTCTLKGFSLTNVKLSTAALRTLQHVVLQSSIKRSGQQPLQLRRLDFSFNKFSMRMAHALATMLELLPSGLEMLQLEQCRLGVHSSTRILSAMKSSHGFSSCLRELNLSGNRLSHAGTEALALWITGAFALHRLDLSRTRLQTNAFLQAFKQNSILHESSLVLLDLSYNRMGTQASYDLGEILGKTQSLSTILLRGMKQPLLHPRRWAADVLAARRRGGRQYIGQQQQTQLALRTPRPMANGLRKLHLKNILAPMFQNISRTFPCLIDLSENDLHGPKAALLAHLIDSSPSAARASLRLDHAALTDKSAVLLLHSLRGCKSLDSLSLEGNGFIARDTKQSYKRFRASKVHTRQALELVPTTLERAAGDAISLLLGGKSHTSSSDAAAVVSPVGGRDDGARDPAFSSSLFHHSHHKPKRLPLKELSLKADGVFVFGPYVLTLAVQALAVNTCLHMLDVSGNECGDALAAALGAVLPVNKSLQVLFWDDNFTTVDGFFQFYEGLLRNQTLSVVQLPINDTRRILEEQKDPPREKLFSVLGKIFKVTERNQTLAQVRDQQQHHPSSTSAHGGVQQRSKSGGLKEDGTISPRTPTRASRRENRQSRNSQHASDTRAVHKIERRAKEADDDKEEKPERAPNADDSVHSNNERKSNSARRDAPSTTDEAAAAPSDDDRGATWAAYYQNATASRYPTTIRNWSRESGPRELDVRASWDQIGALSTMLT